MEVGTLRSLRYIEYCYSPFNVTFFTYSAYCKINTYIKTLKTYRELFAFLLGILQEMINYSQLVKHTIYIRYFI